MTDPTPQTTPTRDEAVAERPRIEPLLKDGDVVERLKQFRLRWQESGDLTYLGKALVDAIVEIEAHRRASAPAPASGGVDAVAVKALEWVHDGEHYRADAGFEIKYSVFRRLDGWFDAVLLGTAIGHGYLSATTAKEACQADYEQRIRSALSPAATPVSEAGGEVEQLKAYRDELLKIAADVGEPDDPFAAWEAIAALKALDKPASSPAGGAVVPGLRAEIAHDGFTGDIIGRYVTREGKRGAVVQQDGTRVVHVYGEKWLPVETQTALSQSSAGRVGE